MKNWRNKLYGVLLLILGIIPVFVYRDGTALILFGLAAVSLFFAKIDYTKGPYEEDVKHD